MREASNPVVERVARSSGEWLRLRGHVGVAHAKHLRDAALASLATGHTITVDATEAEYVDPAVAQVLLALQRSCRSKGTALAWQGPADTVRTNLAKFGLASALAGVDVPR